MRFKHDASTVPIAPIVDLVVTNPGVGYSELRGLVDTGASITALPRRLVKELTLKHIGAMDVRGLFKMETLNIYSVDVTMGGIEFKSCEAVTAYYDLALIGRNLINLWKLTLGGEIGVFDICPWTTDAKAITSRRH